MSDYFRCATCLKYQQTQACKKKIPYEVALKPWEVVGADIFFFVKNKMLFIVDYYSKLSIVKKSDILIPDDLVKASKIVFTDNRLPMKIISDEGISLTSDTLRQLCSQMNIEQAISS